MHTKKRSQTCELQPQLLRWSDSQRSCERIEVHHELRDLSAPLGSQSHFRLLGAARLPLCDRRMGLQGAALLARGHSLHSARCWTALCFLCCVLVVVGACFFILLLKKTILFCVLCFVFRQRLNLCSCCSSMPSQLWKSPRCLPATCRRLPHRLRPNCLNSSTSSTASAPCSSNLFKDILNKRKTKREPCSSNLFKDIF